MTLKAYSQQERQTIYSKAKLVKIATNFFLSIMVLYIGYIFFLGFNHSPLWLSLNLKFDAPMLVAIVASVFFVPLSSWSASFEDYQEVTPDTYLAVWERLVILNNKGLSDSIKNIFNAQGGILMNINIKEIKKLNEYKSKNISNPKKYFTL